MDALFKALDDSTRRTILECLRDKDMPAGDIADQFSVSKPTISHHLDLLRQAELVLARRDGQFIIYSLNAPVLDGCMAWLLKFAKKLKAAPREPVKRPTAVKVEPVQKPIVADVAADVDPDDGELPVSLL
jgi:DNA-binding transcriptional ArsR family regulator